jgi:hypothetical protein
MISCRARWRTEGSGSEELRGSQAAGYYFQGIARSRRKLSFFAQQKNLQTLSYFAHPKNHRQQTSFTTHSTTTSPQKHHTLHSFFLKTPANTALHHREKILTGYPPQSLQQEV